MTTVKNPEFEAKISRGRDGKFTDKPTATVLGNINNDTNPYTDTADDITNSHPADVSEQDILDASQRLSHGDHSVEAENPEAAFAAYWMKGNHRVQERGFDSLSEVYDRTIDLATTDYNAYYHADRDPAEIKALRDRVTGKNSNVWTPGMSAFPGSSSSEWENHDNGLILETAYGMQNPSEPVRDEDAWIARDKFRSLYHEGIRNRERENGVPWHVDNPEIQDQANRLYAAIDDGTYDPYSTRNPQDIQEIADSLDLSSEEDEKAFANACAQGCHLNHLPQPALEFIRDKARDEVQYSDSPANDYYGVFADYDEFLSLTKK